jgi:hypothetical protein
MAPRYVIASAAFLVVCSLLKKGETTRRKHHGLDLLADLRVEDAVSYRNFCRKF